MKKKWIKIIVTLKLGTNSVLLSWEAVKRFKAAFHVEHLYFARYENVSTSTFEVSALTGADWKEIKKVFRRCTGVTGVKIQERGTGSIAHARVFTAVAALPEAKLDPVAEDTALVDLVHWLCNMRGLDYIREARFYGYGVVWITDMIAKNNAKVMSDLQARLKSVDRVSSPKRKPVRSGRAAARKKPAA